MKKIIYLAIILFMIIIPSKSAKAAIVSGEIPLGGISYYLDKYYSSDARYSHDDLELLANVMYHENYCNGETIMYLTGCVVLNRVASKEYPDTIKGVLYAPHQYSTTRQFYTEKIPKSVYQLAAKLLITGSTIPSNVIYQAMFTQGSGVYKVYNGEYFCYR